MNMSLVELREELIEATAAFDAAREAIEEAAKDPSKADVDSLRASFEAAEEKYNATKTEHARAEDRERKARELFDLERKAEDAGKRLTPAPSGGGERVSVGREPLTYRKHGEHSIFTDLYRQQMHGDQAAAQRLARHNKEMQFERGLKSGDIPRDAQFDLNSTDATGGYLVAPLWLNEEFVNLARAGRVAADVLGPRSLPPKTDSINLPRMSTGTAVAVQSDNSTVQETDAAFDTISGDVKTIAGLQDVSQQLVDRSVPGVDEVIYSDLVKAYAVALDVAVLNSSTANNKGLLQASGTNTVTYTQATPTVATLYPKIADAIQQINTNVFLPPDAIIMHPRRWAHVLAGLDTTNRPLVQPDRTDEPGRRVRRRRRAGPRRVDPGRQRVRRPEHPDEHGRQHQPGLDHRSPGPMSASCTRTSPARTWRRSGTSGPAPSRCGSGCTTTTRRSTSAGRRRSL
jgi:HK97 family phage major capsid protein